MASERAAIFDTVKKFETELGITPGFLDRLLTEGDDWSFVIKVHAVAETALTHLLTAGVGRKELRDLFASLTMGDPRRGKLAVAARLRLLDPGRQAFFLGLGRIRNWFVHDVRSVGLRIEDFVNSLQPDQRPRFWRDMMRGHTVEPMIIDSGRSMPTEEFAAAQPRFTIWISAMSALSLIYRTKTLDQASREKLFVALSTMKPIRAKPGSRRLRQSAQGTRTQSPPETPAT